jgi:hypothetical protein
MRGDFWVAILVQAVTIIKKGTTRRGKKEKERNWCIDVVIYGIEGNGHNENVRTNCNDEGSGRMN